MGTIEAVSKFLGGVSDGPIKLSLQLEWCCVEVSYAKRLRGQWGLGRVGRRGVGLGRKRGSGGWSGLSWDG